MAEADALRHPPHSEMAEQSVLGGLLLDNDAIDRIGDLRAEHFYRHDHRILFASIVKMIAANDAADVVTVFEALRSAEKVAEVGGLVYINSLAANTPSAANIRRYAEIVRDRAMKRALITACDEIVEKAFSGEGDARALLDAAGAKLEKLAESRAGSEPVRIGDDLPRHMQVIDDRAGGHVKSIPTGFGDIDRRLNGGISRGQLVVVAARPKMGKSAFALQIARHVAVDHTALMLSLEMPRGELHDRNIAATSRVSLSHILSPHGLEADEWTKVRVASEGLQELNLYIDDQSALRLLDVRMKARLIKRRHSLDLLVVDYLQLMEGQGDNRNAQIEAITRGLKGLAKELDIGIILLSQLNRELEKRDNKRPMPSDLRDSGSIEQDADVVLFLYRDEVYHPDTPQPGICEVNVGLNRQGEPGREGLTYIGHQVRFESHAGAWQAPLTMAPKRARGFQAGST